MLQEVKVPFPIIVTCVFLFIQCSHSHIQWRSFQVIFKEFDVDESGTISMEELREMTHYLGFMPTRLMLEDSRTAYFDRILLECAI